MSRYAMCPVCGRRLNRLKDSWGDWDGETYVCEHCAATADGNDNNGLNVYDAAIIWASNGKDEDYTFGYTESELEAALK